MLQLSIKDWLKEYGVAVNYLSLLMYSECYFRQNNKLVHFTAHLSGEWTGKLQNNVNGLRLDTGYVGFLGKSRNLLHSPWYRVHDGAGQNAETKLNARAPRPKSIQWRLSYHRYTFLGWCKYLPEISSLAFRVSILWKNGK